MFLLHCESMSHLCVFSSSQYLFLSSSSSMSSSLDSIAPLTGMTRAPGSWASTHSLIFASLRKTSSGVSYSSCMGHALVHTGSMIPNLPLVLFSDVILLWEINQVDHGLGCQKQVFVQHLNLLREFKKGTNYETVWFSKAQVMPYEYNYKHTSAFKHTHHYLSLVPLMVKSDVFLLLFYPAFHLQHDIL